MSNPRTNPLAGKYAATLVVRRLIRSTPEKLFAAWTEPVQFVNWWGPESVSCSGAEFDLCPGGHYRIGNRFPDGSLLWIAGEFEAIDPPHGLTFTWRLESHSGEPERVTVSFEPQGQSTEVIVVHERIVDDAARVSHERGWNGCLDGLTRYAESR